MAMNADATEVSIVVGLLVRGEFSVIEAMTQGRYLSADQMQAAIADYGLTLVLPPPEAWDELEVIQSERVDRPTFHVDFPLWTEEEGRSDLTLQLELAELGDGLYQVSVIGIHAL
jgi:hypothetical protein